MSAFGKGLCKYVTAFNLCNSSSLLLNLCSYAYLLSILAVNGLQQVHHSTASCACVHILLVAVAFKFYAPLLVAHLLLHACCKRATALPRHRVMGIPCAIFSCPNSATSATSAFLLSVAAVCCYLVPFFWWLFATCHMQRPCSLFFFCE